MIFKTHFGQQNFAVDLLVKFLTLKCILGQTVLIFETYLSN